MAKFKHTGHSVLSQLSQLSDPVRHYLIWRGNTTTSKYWSLFLRLHENWASECHLNAFCMSPKKLYLFAFVIGKSDLTKMALAKSVLKLGSYLIWQINNIVITFPKSYQLKILFEVCSAQSTKCTSNFHTISLVAIFPIFRK